MCHRLIGPEPNLTERAAEKVFVTAFPDCSSMIMKGLRLMQRAKS